MASDNQLDNLGCQRLCDTELRSNKRKENGKYLPLCMFMKAIV